MNTVLAHGLFGTKHIIILVVCLLLIVLGFIFSKKLSFEKIIKVMLGVGIVSEVIKVFYYIIANEATHGGYLPKTDLPFHLCSIQILFIVFLNISKNEKAKRVLLSFMVPSCLFGGIAALLIATESSRNGMWILTAQYFLYHVAIIIFAMYVLRSQEFNFTIKDYFNCLKFLGVIGMIAIYVNSILNDGSGKINFMYVVAPPADNLPILNLDHGWFVYILSYAGVALLFISLTYIKPIINAIKGLKSDK